MSDFTCQGRLEPYNIGFRFTRSTDLVNGIVVAQDCDPFAAHILGRALTAGLLRPPSQPYERSNIRWGYEGAVKTLIVDVGEDGTLRAMIRPQQLSIYGEEQEDFYGTKGAVQVVTSREGTVLNSGTTQALMLDPVNDLAFYASTSEQVETGSCVMIGFDPDPKRPVRLCHGMQIQAQPGCDLLQFDRLRERLEKSETIRESLGQDLEPMEWDDLIRTLCEEEKEPVQIIRENCPPPRFQCTCSEQKIRSVALLLEEEDRIDIQATGEPLKIRCDFCCTPYSLTVDECLAIWTENELPTPLTPEPPTS